MLEAQRSSAVYTVPFLVTQALLVVTSVSMTKDCVINGFGRSLRPGVAGFGKALPSESDH
jgi:hypothetical protein